MQAFPESRERRIETAAHEAQEAFFAVLVARFAEIKTGDLPPDAAAEFDAACLAFTRRWVVGNWPPT